jgi:DNA polymerase-1
MTDLVVDGNSLYARSWYAAQTINPNANSTLRLAAVTILNLLNPNANSIGHKFDRTLFCWDAQVNEAKKRELKPPEYYEMREVAKEMFTLLLGTAHAEEAPYEGDDLVASAVYAADPDTTVYIVSGDKDLMQLMDSRTHYYSLNDKCVLTEAFVCEKFHVKQPIQIALALAIQGDQADCIPGVKGWGPAKVRHLFSTVSKGMSFMQAVDKLNEQMNDIQCSQFLESLERTLLNTKIKLPTPAPIVYPADEELDALDMPEVSRRAKELKMLQEFGLM